MVLISIYIFGISVYPRIWFWLKMRYSTPTFDAFDHQSLFKCPQYEVFPCISMYFLFAGTEKNVAG